GRAVAFLGTVSGGARLGNGARGLQRERRRLELFSARARALSRLSLERGWVGGHLRSQRAALLCLRVLERARSVFKGTLLRGERTAGQPRRRRKGTLLVHRCHADAQLHVDGLPLSAGGVSVR